MQEDKEKKLIPSTHRDQLSVSASSVTETEVKAKPHHPEWRDLVAQSLKPQFDLVMFEAKAGSIKALYWGIYEERGKKPQKVLLQRFSLKKFTPYRASLAKFVQSASPFWLPVMGICEKFKVDLLKGSKVLWVLPALPPSAHFEVYLTSSTADTWVNRCRLLRDVAIGLYQRRVMGATMIAWDIQQLYVDQAGHARLMPLLSKKSIEENEDLTQLRHLLWQVARDSRSPEKLPDNWDEATLRSDCPPIVKELMKACTDPGTSLKTLAKQLDALWQWAQWRLPDATQLQPTVLSSTGKAERDLVLISLEEKQEIKMSKIKECLQRNNQFQKIPIVIIQQGRIFTLYDQVSTEEWQSVCELDAKKLNELKFEDCPRVSSFSEKENEKLIIRLSLLTSHKDDILRKIKQGSHSRLEKELELRLKEISHIEKELKEKNKKRKLPETKTVLSDHAVTQLVDWVPISTQGGGDCAFHAILGEWNASKRQIVCADIKEKRAKLQATIVSSDSKEPLQGLIVEGIKELIMSGRVIGNFGQALLKRYREFLADQKELSSMTWSQFEIILRKHTVIVEYIQKNHGLATTASLRDQFYDALNRKEGELYGRMLSLPNLHEAFREYSQLQNTAFDWASVILELKSIRQEYADFIGTSQVWLLPSELAIIAHVFNVSVIYYPSPGALPLTLNPTGASVVEVQFDGLDHFERLQSIQYGSVFILSSHQIPLDVYQEITSKQSHTRKKKQSDSPSSQTAISATSASGLDLFTLLKEDQTIPWIEFEKDPRYQVGLKLCTLRDSTQQPSDIKATLPALQTEIQDTLLDSKKETEVLLWLSKDGGDPSIPFAAIARNLWQVKEWQAYRPGDPPPTAWLPLQVNFDHSKTLGKSKDKDSKASAASSFTEAVMLPEAISFDDAQWQELRTHYRLFWLVQGNEELSEHCNLYRENKLYSAVGRSRLLLHSGISAVFKREEMTDFMPHNAYGRVLIERYARYISDPTGDLSAWGGRCDLEAWKDLDQEQDDGESLIIQEEADTLPPPVILTPAKDLMLTLDELKELRCYDTEKPLDPWEKDKDFFLGGGSFGEIWRDQYRGQEVAVKRFSRNPEFKLTAENEAELAKEAKIMAALPSDFLVRVWGYSLLPLPLIIMECLPFSLSKLLKNKSRELPWSLRYRLLRDTALGLLILHTNDLLHCDLKSDNILVDADYRAKLADFGVSNLISKAQGDMGTYIAPEMISSLELKATKASDVYSFGIVCWEVATRGTGIYSLEIERLQTGYWSSPDCPQPLIALIHECCAKKPERRPKVQDIAQRLDKLWQEEISRLIIKDDEKQPTSFQPKRIPVKTSNRFTPIPRSSFLSLFRRKPSKKEPIVSSPGETASFGGPPLYWPTLSPYYTLGVKLRRLRQAVLEDRFIIRELSCYIAPNGQSQAGMGQPSDPLYPWVERELLQGDVQVLVLQGLAGAGKSTFNRHLLRTLWQDLAWQSYRPGDPAPTAPVPIWIPLGSDQVKPTDLWSYYCHMPEIDGFTSAEIQLLQREYHTVWIADGYDEIRGQAALNLYDDNRLRDYAGRIKLIIGCRSQQVQALVEANSFVPHTVTGAPDWSRYRTRHVSSFTKQQTQDYIEKFVAQHQNDPDRIKDWNVARYKKEFAAFSEFQTLIDTPFMLWMTLSILPNLASEQAPVKTAPQEEKAKDKKKDDKEVKATPASLATQPKITRTALYDRFMQTWFTRQARKAWQTKSYLKDAAAILGKSCVQAIKEKASRVGGDDVQVRWLTAAYRQFCLAFAQQLTQAQQVSIPFDSEKEAKEIPVSWQSLLLGDGLADSDKLRQGCPLRESAGHTWSFLHASLLDYFLTTTIAEQLLLNPRPAEEERKTEAMTPKTDTPSAPLLTTQHILFTFSHAKAVTLLNQARLTPDQVRFLMDRVKQEPKLKDALFAVIERSKTDKSVGTASANSATVLNACHVNFSHKDWQNVQLPGADLRYGLFAHSDLRDANLQGATLMRAFLYQTNLEGADLRRVQWGEWPWLELTEGISAVAYHPTQPWVAVALTLGNNLILWDVKTSQAIGKPLIGHTGQVDSVAFSPNGRQLVSGSKDNTLRLWDVITQKPIGEPLSGHKDEVTSVAFSPDGRQLVSASQDGTLQLWDMATQAPLGDPLIGHTEGVRSIAFSPDGRQLVSGSNDKTLRLWDVATHAPLGKPLTGHAEFVISVAFSPNGRQLVSGSADKTLQLWEVATQAPLGKALNGHTGPVLRVVFSPDGRQFASAGGFGDATLRLWDTERRKPIGEPLVGHRMLVSDVAFSPDGRQLVSGSYDKTLRLWEVATQAPLGEALNGHTKSVISVAFSSEGQRLVSASQDGTLCLWEVATQAPLGKPFRGHTEHIESGHIESVKYIAFSPDGRHLVSGGRKTLQWWDVATQKPIGELLTWDEWYGYGVDRALSPDRRQLAVGGFFANKTLQLWDVATQKLIGEPLTGHTESVISVTFSPNGRQLVSGSHDHTLRLWDVETRCCLTVLQWHSSIKSIAMVALRFISQDEKITTVSRPSSTASSRVEDGLVIGDAAGTISFWAVSRQDGRIRFVGMPRHPGMPLWLDGTQLRGCRMDPQTQCLLAQYGAQVKEVVLEMPEEKVVQPVPHKTLSSTGTPAPLLTVPHTVCFPPVSAASSTSSTVTTKTTTTRFFYSQREEKASAASTSTVTPATTLIEQARVPLGQNYPPKATEGVELLGNALKQLEEWKHGNMTFTDTGQQELNDLQQILRDVQIGRSATTSVGTSILSLPTLSRTASASTSTYSSSSTPTYKQSSLPSMPHTALFSPASSSPSTASTVPAERKINLDGSLLKSKRQDLLKETRALLNTVYSPTSPEPQNNYTMYDLQLEEWEKCPQILSPADVKALCVICEELQTIRLKKHGESNPSVATSYHKLGLVYQAMGEMTSALDCHKKALAIQLKVLENTNLSIVISYYYLEKIYRTLDNLKEAENHSKKMCDLIKLIITNPSFSLEKISGWQDLEEDFINALMAFRLKMEHEKSYLDSLGREFKQNNFIQVIKICRKAISSSSYLEIEKDIRSYWISALYKVGHYEELVKVATESLLFKPEPTFLGFRARGKAKLGDFKGADEDLEVLFSIAGDKVSAARNYLFNNVGIVYSEKARAEITAGRLDSALSFCKQAEEQFLKTIAEHKEENVPGASTRGYLDDLEKIRLEAIKAQERIRSQQSEAKYEIPSSQSSPMLSTLSSGTSAIATVAQPTLTVSETKKVKDKMPGLGSVSIDLQWRTLNNQYNALVSRANVLLQEYGKSQSLVDATRKLPQIQTQARECLTQLAELSTFILIMLENARSQQQEEILGLFTKVSDLSDKVNCLLPKKIPLSGIEAKQSDLIPLVVLDSGLPEIAKHTAALTTVATSYSTAAVSTMAGPSVVTLSLTTATSTSIITSSLASTTPLPTLLAPVETAIVDESEEEEDEQEDLQAALRLSVSLMPNTSKVNEEKPAVLENKVIQLSENPSPQKELPAGALSSSHPTTSTTLLSFPSWVQPGMSLSPGQARIYFVLPQPGDTAHFPHILIETTDGNQHHVQQFKRKSSDNPPWERRIIDEVRVQYLRTQAKMIFSAPTPLRTNQQQLFNSLLHPTELQDKPPTVEQSQGREGRLAWQQWYDQWLKRRSALSAPSAPIVNPQSSLSEQPVSAEPLGETARIKKNQIDRLLKKVKSLEDKDDTQGEDYQNLLKKLKKWGIEHAIPAKFEHSTENMSTEEAERLIDAEDISGEESAKMAAILLPQQPVTQKIEQKLVPLFSDKTFINRADESLSKHGLKLMPGYSEGDCFYDAVMEGVPTDIQPDTSRFKRIKWFREQTRQYIYKLDKNMETFSEENVEKEQMSHWIQQSSIWADIEITYSKYKENVQYAVADVDGKQVTESKIVWGEPAIDGVIICNQLGIKIHIIVVGENGSLFHRMVVSDEEAKRLPHDSMLGSLVEERNSKNIFHVDPEKINYSDPKTVHIANTNKKHFTPLQKIPLDLHLSKTSSSIHALITPGGLSIFSPPQTTFPTISVAPLPGTQEGNSPGGYRS